MLQLVVIVLILTALGLDSLRFWLCFCRRNVLLKLILIAIKLLEKEVIVSLVLTFIFFGRLVFVKLQLLHLFVRSLFLISLPLDPPLFFLLFRLFLFHLFHLFNRFILVFFLFLECFKYILIMKECMREFIFEVLIIKKLLDASLDNWHLQDCINIRSTGRLLLEHACDQLVDICRIVFR